MAKEVTPEQIQMLDEMVARAQKAADIIATYDQARVDRLCQAVAAAVVDMKVWANLADEAVDETGLGDKVTKRNKRNKIKLILRDCLRQKSVGAIEEIPEKGIVKYAKPVGVIASLVPTTNPCLTPAGQVVYAIKARDVIICSPHPRAKKVTNKCINIIRETLVREGAPADIIQGIEEPSITLTQELMKRCDLPDSALPRVAPLAWKTGTSYGYRDAWAIGVNARYVIGIWTGRPDGTPVVGQFGFASAVPLLNQVNNILLSRSANLPEDPRPNSVTRGVICWPGGQSLPEGDGNCRRRLATWLLDGSQPPTLLLPEQEGINGIRFPIWLDENGKRVAADCPQARQEMINVWPLPLEPWLPASERRAVRLPPASTSCPPYGHDAQLPLQLTGVRDGAIIKRLPGAAEATLPLQSSGGAGERWWFLNGEPLTERGRNVTLHLTDKGDYQLLVMDDVGQIATVKFVMQ